VDSVKTIKSFINSPKIMTILFRKIPLNPPFPKGEISLFPSLAKRGEGRFYGTLINSFVLMTSSLITICAAREGHYATGWCELREVRKEAAVSILSV
jgi:hypothetical protein